MQIMRLAPLAFFALALTACAPPATTTETSAAPSAVPEAVNGWREYPVRDGVIAVQPAKYQSETIDIFVPAGRDLEYKLAMKKGQTIVYSISYAGLAKPEDMTVEFHGHTEKGADGNGDLMFYSKTAGVTEHGSFTAPWDGIHGWYLNNTGASNVTAKLDVAGFYTKQE